MTKRVLYALAVVLGVMLLGNGVAYGDYTEYLNIIIPQNIPNVCIFEAEEAQVNFQERDFYNKTVNWIQEGWIDNLNNYTNSNNWDMTFEYIPNATHYAMNLEDFPQCHVMIVWDAENDGSRENLGRAQGYTAFDHSKSTHKFSFIDVFTWAPTNKINLGMLSLGNYTQNEDGTYEIPLTEEACLQSRCSLGHLLSELLPLVRDEPSWLVRKLRQGANQTNRSFHGTLLKARGRGPFAQHRQLQY